MGVHRACRLEPGDRLPRSAAKAADTRALANQGCRGGTGLHAKRSGAPARYLFHLDNDVTVMAPEGWEFPDLAATRHNVIGEARRGEARAIMTVRDKR